MGGVGYCCSGSARGAAHEENKGEYQQQAVHRLVQVTLGEQCEDGCSVCGIKHIHWGAPTWESTRPRESTGREGYTRNAESERQTDSQNSH